MSLYIHNLLRFARYRACYMARARAATSAFDRKVQVRNARHCNRVLVRYIRCIQRGLVGRE